MHSLSRLSLSAVPLLAVRTLVSLSQPLCLFSLCPFRDESMHRVCCSFCGSDGRASWDLMAVLYAVRGLSGHYLLEVSPFPDLTLPYPTLT